MIILNAGKGAGVNLGGVVLHEYPDLLGDRRIFIADFDKGHQRSSLVWAQFV
jgi:hypothetical protein